MPGMPGRTGASGPDDGSTASSEVRSRSAAWVWEQGVPATMGGVVEPGGLVDRSSRRRGQSLVVVGALLGALGGVALGLAVGGPQTSAAVAAPAPARSAAVAATPPTSQPTASQSSGSRDWADGRYVHRPAPHPVGEASWQGKDQGGQGWQGIPEGREQGVRRSRERQARQGQWEVPNRRVMLLAGSPCRLLPSPTPSAVHPGEQAH